MSVRWGGATPPKPLLEEVMLYKCDFCGKGYPIKKMNYIYLKPYYGNESDCINKYICNDCAKKVFIDNTNESEESK